MYHYFFEGIGLRQLCDLCRYSWTNRDKLNVQLLESRIRKAGIMTGRETIATFAVDHLGMPVEVMSLYSANKKWKKEGDKMCRFVMKVGNFGHKQCRVFSEMPYVKRKFFSFWRRLSSMLKYFSVFPLDSIRFFGGVVRSGVHAV